MYEQVGKIFITICPRELHVLVCKPVAEGNYKRVYDKCKTLWLYWPNFLKQTTDKDMIMCACDKYQDVNDLHAG